MRDLNRLSRPMVSDFVLNLNVNEIEAKQLTKITECIFEGELTGVCVSDNGLERAMVIKSLVYHCEISTHNDRINIKVTDLLNNPIVSCVDRDYRGVKYASETAKFIIDGFTNKTKSLRTVH